MKEDRTIYPSAEAKESRYRLRDSKGCGYWQADVNLKNCSFPACFCYPTWQNK